LKCSPRDTHAGGVRFCRSQGAHICSLDELVGARGLDGCTQLEATRVWTSTACVKGERKGFYTCEGNGKISEEHPRRCLSTSDTSEDGDEPKLSVRCCASDVAAGGSARPNAVGRLPIPSFDSPIQATCDSVQGEVVVAAQHGPPKEVAVYVAPKESDADPPSNFADTPDEGSFILGRRTFVVSSLAPSTEYRVWAAVHYEAGWSGWSHPATAVTVAETDSPPVPHAPSLGPVLGCDQAVLKLPPVRSVGCAAEQQLHVEISSRGGDDWARVEVERSGTARVLVRGLDPLTAYQFRAVATNARGSSASIPTDPFALELVPNSMLTPPTVKTTSSQSLLVEWSHLTSGCASSGLLWQISYRRQGDAGDAWQIVETSYPHTLYRALLSCPDGCSFKVLPSILRWTQSSAASIPVTTSRLPSPPAGTIRLLARMLPGVYALGTPGDEGIIRVFEAALREALQDVDGVVQAVEARRAEAGVVMVVDMRPVGTGVDKLQARPSYGLASELLRQVDAASSKLRLSELGSYIDSDYGVAREVERDGRLIVEELVRSELEALAAAQRSPYPLASNVPAVEPGGTLLAPVVISVGLLAPAFVVILLRRRRQRASAGEYVGITNLEL